MYRKQKQKSNIISDYGSIYATKKLTVPDELLNQKKIILI